MAITYTDNGGGAPNGSDLEFTYTFPVIQTEDVKVALNAVVQATTKYAVDTASNPTKITFNNTSIDSNVQESTGAPKSGVTVRVFRETQVGKSTGDDDPKAVFAAGSSIRATDLNANTEQALYAIHELQEQPITDQDIEDGAITSAKIQDGTIANVDVSATAAIAGTKIAPDFGSQNIATTGTVNGVSTTELAILDGATVSTAELNTLDGITASTTELNKLDGFTGSTSELNILDGITASNVEINVLDGVTATTAELNILDGVTATTTELNHVDGVTSDIQAQLNSLSTDKQPLDAELTELATMSSGTASALADLTQDEVQILDGVTATTAELNLNDGQTATSTEVNILDGATLDTTELNKLDGVTASTTELNLLAGKSIVTSISGSATDVQIPSAQAVNERVVELVTEVGGFHPIANETSFPATNPDINDEAGTIVSLKALSSSFSTGSGVTTHTFTNGAGTGNNVIINGLPAATTFPAGRGLLLETTSTLHTYNYHRLTLDEAGVANAQAVVDDFDERYYGPFSANQATRPSGANRVNGDLYFNTSDGKMKVFNGSHASGTWDDVAAPGNFFINTLSSSSGSGGGSATFNNTATRFTLSNPPTAAAQLLVSVNGVIQKPNSGTSPSEGFAIDGSDIIFAAAPASNAPFFIVTIGSSVNIGTPSNNTVTSEKIVDGSIVNGDISSSAAIALSKLATGTLPSGLKVNHNNLQTGIIEDENIGNSAAIALTKLATSGTPNNTNFLRGDGAWTVVNTDLVSDSSPQLGGDLDTNGHHILFDDDHQIKFGASNDLVIQHNTNENYIQSNSGNIYIRCNVDDDEGDNIYLQPKSGDNSAVFVHDGEVKLFHANSLKFETTSNGASVTGDLGIGITTPANEYSRNLQVHAPGTGAVLKLTDSNSGSGAGNGFDLIGYNEHAYVYNRENGNLYFATNGTSRAYFNSTGHFLPQVNNTYDLGSTSYRWSNIYTNDLHLSNEGSSNDVDNTWGDWTIQEGESDLFLKNNRSGKKYKFNLTEVS
tara:strand:+ start:334 stop:3378 length:3045 start_codon:yes stop_codon:yes gene_type:complete